MIELYIFYLRVLGFIADVHCCNAFVGFCVSYWIMHTSSQTTRHGQTRRNQTLFSQVCRVCLETGSNALTPQTRLNKTTVTLSTCRQFCLHHRQDQTVLSCLVGGVNWALEIQDTMDKSVMSLRCDKLCRVCSVCLSEKCASFISHSHCKCCLYQVAMHTGCLGDDSMLYYSRPAPPYFSDVSTSAVSSNFDSTN